MEEAVILLLPLRLLPLIPPFLLFLLSSLPASAPNTASSDKSEEAVSEETVLEEAVVLLLPLRLLLLILTSAGV
jgi:hypothetical protein